MYLPIEHPALGTNKVQNAPFKMSQTPAENRFARPDDRPTHAGDCRRPVGHDLDDVRAGFDDGTFWPVKRPRFSLHGRMLR